MEIGSRYRLRGHPLGEEVIADKRGDETWQVSLARLVRSARNSAGYGFPVTKTAVVSPGTMRVPV